ncbi:MAG: hypothetical protein HXS53_08675 [Theionarchaea archaeon]|nr:hypothetical protein [Theionarchaea archaeon]
MKIIESITAHGTPIYSEKEFHIKPYRNRADACYYGDILAVYKYDQRWYLVGIEVKDWKTKVGINLARRYLNTYGAVCEYFYLAARRFSGRLYGSSPIGLFSLEKMEVVKRPRYLFPDEILRSEAIRRMKKSGLSPEVIESPYQTTLDMYIR